MNTLTALLYTFSAKISIGSGGDVKNVPKLEANNVLTGVLTTVYYVAGITAVIVIIVGGIMYATSQGDSGKVQQAKNMILYAVIGLIFVIMAFLITQFVITRVNA